MAMHGNIQCDLVENWSLFDMYHMQTESAINLPCRKMYMSWELISSYDPGGGAGDGGSNLLFDGDKVILASMQPLTALMQEGKIHLLCLHALAFCFPWR